MINNENLFVLGIDDISEEVLSDKINKCERFIIEIPCELIPKKITGKALKDVLGCHGVNIDIPISTFRKSRDEPSVVTSIIINGSNYFVRCFESFKTLMLRTKYGDTPIRISGEPSSCELTIYVFSMYSGY